MMSTKAFLLLLMLYFILLYKMEIYKGEKLVVEDGKIDCKSRCAHRCSKAGRRKICMRACNTCCARCNCVPPGTAGNTDVCPCYAAMKTHHGRPKCPRARISTHQFDDCFCYRKKICCPVCKVYNVHAGPCT